jgi:hypothetical protein
MIMGAGRESTQADFDLERFIEMFDEALTSNDERVVNALRSLMMMVILTKSETHDTKLSGRNGPLRQLFEDMHHINSRLHTTEDAVRNIQRTLEPVYQRAEAKQWAGLEKYPQPTPYSMSADQAKAAGMQISKEFAQSVNGGLIKPTTKEGI